jgi:hypothetical protein
MKAASCKTFRIRKSWCIWETVDKWIKRQRRPCSIFSKSFRLLSTWLVPLLNQFFYTFDTNCSGGASVYRKTSTCTVWHSVKKRSCVHAINGVWTPNHSCCSCRWGETMSVNCGHKRAYCSSLRCYMRMENHGGIILTEERRRTLRKTCPSDTLSTTNPTRSGPGANRSLRGERPATNRLSHSTPSHDTNISLLTHRHRWAG